MPLPLDRFLATHPYYTYKDLLHEVFADDEDAFIDAWGTGTLPLAVRHACQDTMGERTLEVLLLSRMIRLLLALLHASQQPWEAMAPPPPERDT